MNAIAVGQLPLTLGKPVSSLHFITFALLAIKNARPQLPLMDASATAVLPPHRYFCCYLYRCLYRYSYPAFVSLNAPVAKPSITTLIDLSPTP
jgi:hypothetical protein